MKEFEEIKEIFSILNAKIDTIAYVGGLQVESLSQHRGDEDLMEFASMCCDLLNAVCKKIRFVNADRYDMAPSGLAQLSHQIWALEYMLKGWVSPKLSVSPGARRGKKP